MPSILDFTLNRYVVGCLDVEGDIQGVLPDDSTISLETDTPDRDGKGPRV